MRVYVTGIAGFIGSHLADRLLHFGHTVIGCDDLSTGRAENVPAGVPWMRSSVQHVAGIDADVVVHLAAIPCTRWGDDHQMWRANLESTAVALVAAEASGARFVFASTAAAVDGQSVYARSKAAAEHLVLAHGGTVLRLANVYGPRQRDWGPEPGVLAAWRAALDAGEPIRVDGDGTQTRDFVHVDDAARAFALTAECPDADGLVVDICTGRQTAIRDIAATLAPEDTWIRGERAPGDLDQAVQDPALAERLLCFAATPWGHT